MPDDLNAPAPPPLNPAPAAPVRAEAGPGRTATSHSGPAFGAGPNFGATYAPAAGYVPFAYTPRKPKPGWFWPVIILTIIAVLALALWGIVYAAMHSADDSAGSAFASSRIAVIDIDGVILDSEKVDTQLRKFGDDSTVKAIILHINSPGGGAAASQEIYHEVLRVRSEKHKKIVASVESVGASGAYYIASACDRIYANEASVVGSIGVIMEWTNYGDLLRWAKLKSVVIHAGTLKDAGDPTHDMTPEEAVYFQSLVDNMYGQFVRDVASGRHTSPEKIRPLATGQVWTGEQSLALGLIDKVGGYRVALMDTAGDVGISGEPTVVRPASQKRGLAAVLSGESDDLFPNPTRMLDHAPGFYFMWK